jgi:lysophospholipase L1-like esterase
MIRPTVLRPGPFGVTANADTRRRVFDLQNEALLGYGVAVDAVFIGDSITDMWALDVFFKGTNGFVINRGIAGDRTQFTRRRIAADVLQLHPRLVVLLIGINNTWDLDVWWDATLARTPETIENEIIADSITIIKAAKEAAVPLALCSILPTNIPFNGNSAIRNKLVVAANARLREVASQEGAVFVDYHRLLAEKDGLTMQVGVSDDGLHPHMVGYEIMANELLTALDAVGVRAIERRRHA